MNAYLEVITVTTAFDGTKTCSTAQTTLKFRDHDTYSIFVGNLDAYEKCSGFEVYRSIIPYL